MIALPHPRVVKVLVARAYAGGVLSRAERDVLRLTAPHPAAVGYWMGPGPAAEENAACARCGGALGTLVVMRKMNTDPGYVWEHFRCPRSEVQSALSTGAAGRT